MSKKADLSENLLAARLETALIWIIERRVQFLIALGILVAAILIGSVFFLRRGERVDEARAKLSQAQALISQAKFAQAAPLLAEIAAAGADADTTRLSAYFAGVCALEQNKLDEATSLLNDAVGKSGGHPLRPLARSVLGTALEQKKDYTGAIANYAAFIAETPEHFLSARIQLALGRAHLLAGHHEDARKALEHLIDQFPTTEWAENARRLLDINRTR